MIQPMATTEKGRRTIEDGNLALVKDQNLVVVKLDTCWYLPGSPGKRKCSGHLLLTRVCA